MTFEEMLGQVRELLQSKQRVSYRALKRQFALDDDYLEDLKAEIIKAQQLAIDEADEVLVWTGEVLPQTQGPTPPTSNRKSHQTRRQTRPCRLAQQRPGVRRQRPNGAN